jgi:periplasmic divalent cation tolerance protein
MPMRNFCISYITFPSKKEAEKIAKELLEKKIVACCNIFPIKSLYWWEGKIKKANEFVLIAKTLKKDIGKLEKLVKKLHPYKIPFIGIFDVKINEEYFQWAKGLK